MSIRIETRDVTPEMARYWMGKNRRNRAINRNRVNLYAEEMRNGNWLHHHQGIAFYADGTLADGQHRLAAIEQSGVTIKMIIAWNVPEESGLMIDGHQQRATHQAIRISGLADWISAKHVAVARMMIDINRGTIKASSISHAEIIKYCEQHKSSIIFSSDGLGNNKRGLTAAPMKAAVACAFYFEDKVRLKEFCEVISTGMPNSKEDKAAIHIREWFIEKNPSSGTERLNGCKRAMRAIKAFCDRQPINKIYEPADFIYVPPTGENQ